MATLVFFSRGSLHRALAAALKFRDTHPLQWGISERSRRLSSSYQAGRRPCLKRTLLSLDLLGCPCCWSACPTAAKTARLRQAKEEAEREAAAYRAQREADYQKKKKG